MSRGSYVVLVPHICGQLVEVAVYWSHYPATRETPSDDYAEVDHADKCPKCGIDLFCDDLFQRNIDMAPEPADLGEYMPHDDVDYEPLD